MSGRDWILLFGSGVLFALLAALVLSEWHRGQARLESVITVSRGAADVGGVTDIPALPSYGGSLERYGEIVNRPLFSRDRRPVADVASYENKRPSKIDKLVLTGMVSGPNARVAILVDMEINKELRMSEGQMYNGWKLESFEGDAVTFSYRGRVRRFELPKKMFPRAGMQQPAAMPPLNPHAIHNEHGQNGNARAGAD